MNTHVCKKTCKGNHGLNSLISTSEKVRDKSLLGSPHGVFHYKCTQLDCKFWAYSEKQRKEHLETAHTVVEKSTIVRKKLTQRKKAPVMEVTRQVAGFEAATGMSTAVANAAGRVAIGSADTTELEQEYLPFNPTARGRPQDSLDDQGPNSIRGTRNILLTICDVEGEHDSYAV